MKSLQLSLNELIPRLGLRSLTVSNAAYSKVRRKFKHTAFIELNPIAVGQAMYEDEDFRTWHSRRILAVDGSQVILPNTPDIRGVFGARRFANQRSGIQGEHCYGLASVLYDVLKPGSTRCRACAWQ